MKFNFQTSIQNKSILSLFFLICTALILITTEARRASVRSKSKGRVNSEIQKLRYKLFSKSRSESESKRKLKAFMAAREPRQDDDLPDPEVVYTISLAMHGTKNATCSYPLSFVKSTTCEGGMPCDLNDGNGGNYVYLCVGKKKISMLGDGENMMSKIHVNINNKDCGSLKEVSGSIKNSWAWSDSVTFCYGFEQGQMAISDITVFFRKSKEDTLPKNCKEEIVKNKFLCYSYADNVPKKIEYVNLNLLAKEENVSMMGMPEVMAEIDNDNGTGRSDNTIKRGIIYTNVKTYTWNIEHKYGAKVETKVSITTPIIETGKFQLQAAFDVNRSTNTGEITTDTDYVQTDYSCLAPAGKYYKCKAIMSRLEANIPYTIVRRIYLQDGKVEEKTIKSSFKGVTSSSMRFERCCYRNCSAKKDRLCPENADGKLTGVCPKIENIMVEQADKKSVGDPIKNGENVLDVKNVDTDSGDPKLNPEILTDLKVIEGDSTTCPDSYKFVTYSHKDQKVDFNSAIYFSNSYYIYVCMKKTRLYDAQSLPINTIIVNRYNKDCGILTTAMSHIWNSPGGSDKIYLCYGHDASTKLAPINNIVLVDEDHITTISKEYECSDVKIEKLTLCYTRDKNAPSRFEVRDFTYEFDKAKKRQVGPPKKVNEITVNSTSASIMVKVTKRSESTYKKSWDFGVAVGVKLSGSVLGFEAESTVSGSYRRTSTEETKDAKEVTETSNIECIAVEKKTIKCVSSVIEYKISVPYKSKMYPYDYEGKIMSNFIKDITGTYESVQSSSINMRTCCQGDGCCTGNLEKEKNLDHCWDVDKPHPKDTKCEELNDCFDNAASTTKLRRFRRYKY